MPDVQNRFKKQPLFFQPKAASTPAGASSAPSGRHPVWHAIGTGLRRTCIALGAFVLFIFVVGTIAGMRAAAGERIPDQMILYMRLHGDYVEYRTSGFPFGAQQASLRDVVDSIDAAATDKRVKGIVAEESGGPSDLAQMQELHDAILKFRQRSGKFTYIYGEDFGGGLGSYYLASAFQQIWMQPMGMLSIPGVDAEMPYARALLDKVGVTPDFFARGEYKNLFESFELKDMSPATKESMGALVGDLGNTLLNGIAVARNKPVADVTNTVNTGLLTDVEALHMGYIDQIGYRDALMEGLRQKLVGDKDDDKHMPFINIEAYARAFRKAQDRRQEFSSFPHVALIYAVGEISSGSDEAAIPGTPKSISYGEGGRIKGDDLAAAIKKAARDKEVRVIVMRVNSPGGSPTASETIRRAVVYAKERGKKVYVSMGGAAASGGYWISTSADRIYASPLTLTGSIGVAGGKFVLQDLWQKIGVNWNGITLGNNAGMQSLNKPFSDTQRARMNAMFDHIYDGFVQRVSEGRRMTYDRANQVARGRVWSGRQGNALGLVDRLGGLDVTMNDVAKELGQPDRFHLDVEVLPEPQTPFKKIFSLIQDQSRLGDTLHAQQGLMKILSPAIDQLDASTESGFTAYEPVKVH